MRNIPYQTNAKLALASLVIAGLIAVIPFLLPHYGLATAFYSEWTAIALGIVACFPLLFRNFWLHLEIPHSAIWLFAFVVLIALQAPFVGHAYVTQALLPGIYITWATVLIVLSTWIRKQLGLERSLAVLAWMLLIGGALHAVFGLVQYFDVSGQWASIVDQRASASIYGNIGQPNHFAAHITLASFALIFLYATDRIKRARAIVLLLLFAFVLTASSSRAAAVYLISGFLLSLFSHHAAKTRVHHRLMQGAGLLLALFLLFQLLLPHLNDWLKMLLGAMGFEMGDIKTLVMLQRDATDGIDLRISEWRKAWKMFLESPLWGIGIDNYGWYSFNYQTLPEFSAISRNRLFHHSHNVVMQVLAELGIVGLLLLIILAIAWLRQVLPLWKMPSHWLILSLVTVLLLHSAVEYPLWYSYFLGIAAVLLGLADKSAVKIEFTPGLGQFTAGASFVFSGAILFITLLSVHDLNRASWLTFATTPQQTSATLHAISKNPLLTPWAEAAFALHRAPDMDAIEQQLLLTNRVMQYRPTPPFVNRQITYLALAGRSDEASALIKKAFIIYPSDFSKFACSWKRAPTEEVRHLWAEAEKLAGGVMECQTLTKTPTGSS